MEKIAFAPNVLLADAACLNRVGNDMARHFAPIVKRELPEADLPVLLECLALDAGVTAGDNEIQVIFIYDSRTPAFDFCRPSRFETELHNVAFKSRLGEFSLYSFQPSDMASGETLFMETLQLLGESKEAVNVAVIADEPAYGDKVVREVAEWKKKNRITVFGMNPPALPSDKYRYELMGFAVLQSLGIRGDEL